MPGPLEALCDAHGPLGVGGGAYPRLNMGENLFKSVHPTPLRLKALEAMPGHPMSLSTPDCAEQGRESRRLVSPLSLTVPGSHFVETFSQDSSLTSRSQQGPIVCSSAQWSVSQSSGLDSAPRTAVGGKS